MAQDFIDFAALKESISFEKAIDFLGLALTRHGDQLRGECPTCDTDNPRALVITPSKGFYCFGDKRGGDVVGLVAHCKGIGQRDAAQLMQRELMGNSTSTSTSRSTSTRNRTSTSSRGRGLQEPKQETAAIGLTPLDYLDPAHEDVEALGMTVEDAEALGAGHASKGVLRGLVAVPLRTAEGVLVGYAGIAEGRVGKLHIPKPNVVPLHPKRRA